MIHEPLAPCELDFCTHVWGPAEDGRRHCLSRCGVELLGRLAENPPARLDWSQVVIVRPGRLLRPVGGAA